MLTSESLALRIKAWSQALQSEFARMPPVPILLYQEIYRFIHELKASAGISNVAAIKTMVPMIDRCEEWLRMLAQDEHELSDTLNEKLLALVHGLDRVEVLDHFLETTKKDWLTLGPTGPELLSRPLPWDSLSRARARSAWRHGCRFFARERKVALQQLVTEHEASLAEVRGLGGVPILRELAPASTEGSTLIIRTRHIVAFPDPIAAQLSTEWQAL
jgi:hypothetical protein